jgi:hypothetical protein
MSRRDDHGQVDDGLRRESKDVLPDVLDCDTATFASGGPDERGLLENAG